MWAWAGREQDQEKLTYLIKWDRNKILPISEWINKNTNTGAIENNRLQKKRKGFSSQVTERELF